MSCWRNHKLRLSVRVISTLLIHTFVFTNSAFAVGTRNIFSKPRLNYQGRPQEQRKASSKPAPLVNDTQITPLSSSELAIPKALGTIAEVWQPDMQSSENIASSGKGRGTGVEVQVPGSKGQALSIQTGQPLIVHIRDAHCNYEAQKNIAAILEHLIKKYNLWTVMIEGGSAGKDYSLFPLRDRYTDKALEEATEKLLKKGEITGDEALTATTDYGTRLIGAEDRNLYDECMGLALKIDDFRGEAVKLLEGLEAVTSEVKERIYPELAKELEKAKGDYQKEAVGLKDYQEALIELSKKAGLDVERDYPGLASYSKAVALEREIDFEEVNDERTELIQSLTKALPELKLKQLLQATRNFKNGELSEPQYYRFLTGLTDLRDKINLARYVEYLGLNESIQTAQLSSQRDLLFEKTLQSFLKTNQQRQISEISKGLDILSKLAGLSLSPDEYEYFKANREDFQMSRWVETLGKLSKERLSRSYLLLDRYIPTLESFYTKGTAREKAIFENTLKQMKLHKAQVIALRTGGFHTPGLTKMFKDNNISYVVISPKITTELDANLYHKVLRSSWAPSSSFAPNPDNDKRQVAKGAGQVPNSERPRARHALSRISLRNLAERTHLVLPSEFADFVDDIKHAGMATCTLENGEIIPNKTVMVALARFEAQVRMREATAKGQGIDFEQAVEEARLGIIARDKYHEEVEALLRRELGTKPDVVEALNRLVTDEVMEQFQREYYNPEGDRLEVAMHLIAEYLDDVYGRELAHIPEAALIHLPEGLSQTAKVLLSTVKSNDEVRAALVNLREGAPVADYDEIKEVLESDAYKGLAQVFRTYKGWDPLELNDFIFRCAAANGRTFAEEARGALNVSKVELQELEAKMKAERGDVRYPVLSLGGGELSKLMRSIGRKLGLPVFNLVSNFDDGGSTHTVGIVKRDFGHGRQPSGAADRGLATGAAATQAKKQVLQDRVAKEPKGERTFRAQIPGVIISALETEEVPGYDPLTDTTLVYFLSSLLTAARLVDERYGDEALAALPKMSGQNLLHWGCEIAAGYLPFRQHKGLKKDTSKAELASFLFEKAAGLRPQDGHAAFTTFGYGRFRAIYADYVVKGTDEDEKVIIGDSNIDPADVFTARLVRRKLVITNYNDKEVYSEATGYTVGNPDFGGLTISEREIIFERLRQRLYDGEENPTLTIGRGEDNFGEADTVHSSRLIAWGLDYERGPQPELSEAARRAYESKGEGEAIFVGPGSEGTSVGAHLMVKGTAYALYNARKNGARVVYIFNPSETNESYNLGPLGIIELHERLLNEDEELRVALGRPVEFQDVFTDVILNDNEDEIVTDEHKELINFDEHPETAIKKNRRPMPQGEEVLSELRRRFGEDNVHFAPFADVILFTESSLGKIERSRQVRYLEGRLVPVFIKMGLWPDKKEQVQKLALELFVDEEYGLFKEKNGTPPSEKEMMTLLEKFGYLEFVASEQARAAYLAKAAPRQAGIAPTVLGGAMGAPQILAQLIRSAKGADEVSDAAFKTALRQLANDYLSLLMAPDSVIVPESAREALEGFRNAVALSRDISKGLKTHLLGRLSSKNGVYEDFADIIQVAARQYEAADKVSATQMKRPRTEVLKQDSLSMLRKLQQKGAKSVELLFADRTLPRGKTIPSGTTTLPIEEAIRLVQEEGWTYSGGLKKLVAPPGSSQTPATEVVVASARSQTDGATGPGFAEGGVEPFTQEELADMLTGSTQEKIAKVKERVLTTPGLARFAATLGNGWGSDPNVAQVYVLLPEPVRPLVHKILAGEITPEEVADELAGRAAAEAAGHTTGETAAAGGTAKVPRTGYDVVLTAEAATEATAPTVPDVYRMYEGPARAPQPSNDRAQSPSVEHTLVLLARMPRIVPNEIITLGGDFFRVTLDRRNKPPYTKDWVWCVDELHDPNSDEYGEPYFRWFIGEDGLLYCQQRLFSENLIVGENEDGVIEAYNEIARKAEAAMPDAAIPPAAELPVQLAAGDTEATAKAGRDDDAAQTAKANRLLREDGDRHLGAPAGQPGTTPPDDTAAREVMVSREGGALTVQIPFHSSFRVSDGKEMWEELNFFLREPRIFATYNKEDDEISLFTSVSYREPVSRFHMYDEPGAIAGAIAVVLNASEEWQRSYGPVGQADVVAPGSPQADGATGPGFAEGGVEPFLTDELDSLLRTDEDGLRGRLLRTDGLARLAGALQAQDSERREKARELFRRLPAYAQGLIVLIQNETITPEEVAVILRDRMADVGAAKAPAGLVPIKPAARADAARADAARADAARARRPAGRADDARAAEAAAPVETAYGLLVGTNTGLHETVDDIMEQIGADDPEAKGILIDVALANVQGELTEALKRDAANRLAVRLAELAPRTDSFGEATSYIMQLSQPLACGVIRYSGAYSDIGGYPASEDLALRGQDNHGETVTGEFRITEVPHPRKWQEKQTKPVVKGRIRNIKAEGPPRNVLKAIQIDGQGITEEALWYLEEGKDFQTPQEIEAWSKYREGREFLTEDDRRLLHNIWRRMLPKRQREIEEVMRKARRGLAEEEGCEAPVIEAGVTKYDLYDIQYDEHGKVIADNAVGIGIAGDYFSGRRYNVGRHEGILRFIRRIQRDYRFNLSRLRDMMLFELEVIMEGHPDRDRIISAYKRLVDRRIQEEIGKETREPIDMLSPAERQEWNEVWAHMREATLHIPGHTSADAVRHIFRLQGRLIATFGSSPRWQEEVEDTFQKVLEEQGIADVSRHLWLDFWRKENSLNTPLLAFTAFTRWFQREYIDDRIAERRGIPEGKVDALTLHAMYFVDFTLRHDRWATTGSKRPKDAQPHTDTGFLDGIDDASLREMLDDFSQRWEREKPFGSYEREEGFCDAFMEHARREIEANPDLEGAPQRVGAHNGDLSAAVENNLLPILKRNGIVNETESGEEILTDTWKLFAWWECIYNWYRLDDMLPGVTADIQYNGEPKRAFMPEPLRDRWNRIYNALRQTHQDINPDEIAFRIALLEFSEGVLLAEELKGVDSEIAVSAVSYKTPDAEYAISHRRELYAGVVSDMSPQEKAKVRAKVKSIIAEELKVEAETATFNASFKDDLGADSKGMFKLARAFEREFGIKLPYGYEKKLTDGETTVGQVTGEVIGFIEDRYHNEVVHTVSDARALLRAFEPEEVERAVRENQALWRKLEEDVEEAQAALSSGRIGEAEFVEQADRAFRDFEEGSQELKQDFTVRRLYSLSGREKFVKIRREFDDKTGRYKAVLKFSDFSGRPIEDPDEDPDIKVEENKPVEIDVADKGRFRTFGEKEINQIPLVILRSAINYLKLDRSVNMDAREMRRRFGEEYGINVDAVESWYEEAQGVCRREGGRPVIVLTAVGSAENDGLAATAFLRYLLPGVEILPVSAGKILSTVSEYDPKKVMLVGISNSGTTSLTAKVLSWARKEGVTCVAVTGNPDKEIGAYARNSGGTIKVHSGQEFAVYATKGFTGPLYDLCIMGYYFNHLFLRFADPEQKEKMLERRHEVFDSLYEIPRMLNRLVRPEHSDLENRNQNDLYDEDSLVNQAGRHFRAKNGWVLIGDMWNNPINSEIGIKIGEVRNVGWQNFDYADDRYRNILRPGLPAERKKGVFVNATSWERLPEALASVKYALVEGGHSVMVQTYKEGPEGIRNPIYDVLKRLEKEFDGKGKRPRLFVVETKHTHWALQGLADVVFGQKFCIAVARAAGLTDEEMDAPRNLAKTVTVAGIGAPGAQLNVPDFMNSQRFKEGPEGQASPAERAFEAYRENVGEMLEEGLSAAQEAIHLLPLNHMEILNNYIFGEGNAIKGSREFNRAFGTELERLKRIVVLADTPEAHMAGSLAELPISYTEVIETDYDELVKKSSDERPLSVPLNGHICKAFFDEAERKVVLEPEGTRPGGEIKLDVEVDIRGEKVTDIDRRYAGQKFAIHGKEYTLSFDVRRGLVFSAVHPNILGVDVVVRDPSCRNLEQEIEEDTLVVALSRPNYRGQYEADIGGTEGVVPEDRLIEALTRLRDDFQTRHKGRSLAVCTIGGMGSKIREFGNSSLGAIELPNDLDMTTSIDAYFLGLMKLAVTLGGFKGIPEVGLYDDALKVAPVLSEPVVSNGRKAFKTVIDDDGRRQLVEADMYDEFVKLNQTESGHPYDTFLIIGGGQDRGSVELYTHSLNRRGLTALPLYVDESVHGPYACIHDEISKFEVESAKIGVNPNYDPNQMPRSDEDVQVDLRGKDIFSIILATDSRTYGAAIKDAQRNFTRSGRFILVVKESDKDNAEVRESGAYMVITVPDAINDLTSISHSVLSQIVAEEFQRSIQKPAQPAPSGESRLAGKGRGETTTADERGADSDTATEPSDTATEPSDTATEPSDTEGQLPGPIGGSGGFAMAYIDEKLVKGAREARPVAAAAEAYGALEHNFSLGTFGDLSLFEVIERRVAEIRRREDIDESLKQQLVACLYLQLAGLEYRPEDVGRAIILDCTAPDGAEILQLLAAYVPEGTPIAAVVKAEAEAEQLRQVRQKRGLGEIHIASLEGHRSSDNPFKAAVEGLQRGLQKIVENLPGSAGSAGRVSIYVYTLEKLSDFAKKAWELKDITPVPLAPLIRKNAYNLMAFILQSVGVTAGPTADEREALEKGLETLAEAF